MATLVVQAVTEEIEAIATVNGVTETRSETLVAMTVENNEARVAKEFSSTDSGVSFTKSMSDASATSSQTTVNCVNENVSSAEPEEDQNKCSQESKASSCSTKSSQSSVSKKSDKSSSSNSTLKGSQNVADEDENSCSSVSSTSTVKTSQPVNDKSDNESSSGSQSRRSSPEKQTQSSVRSSQSKRTDTDDNDSRSSFTSSHSRSTTKNSQPVTEKSDDESSRSSFKSSTKNSQPVSDKSDDESSRSSFKSSQRSSPAKQTQSSVKSSQSARTDLTEDNDSRSSFTSSHSRSTIKNSQPEGEKSDDDKSSRSSSKSPTKSSQPVSNKSDDESSRSSFKSSKKGSPEKLTENKANKPKKYFSIVDSDSEDDIAIPQRSQTEKSNDSDSAKSDNSQASKSSKKSKKKKRRIVSGSESSDSEKEEEQSQPANKSKISNLIDSDSGSGSDQRSDAGSPGPSDTEQSKGSKKKTEKKRTGSARASKDKAMQEIHSETQRLIRESRLSLPYHRPKQRTLEEFLNRKRVASTIPSNLTCAEKVKMSSAFISKVVQEKEKEAEDFYKSSESEEEEEEEDENKEPAVASQPSVTNIDENSVPNEMQVNMAEMVDTQKITDNHIQDVRNKREALQRRSLDFGVPRKLFSGEINDADDTESIKMSQDDESMDVGSADVEKMKNKELKVISRDLNASKKLFEGMEDMEVDEDDSHSVALSQNTNEDKEKSEECSEKSKESTENQKTFENSAEDIVLNMSESEQDTSGEKKQESSIDSDQVKDQESIMISETPMISSKEFQKQTEEVNKSDDFIFKLPLNTAEKKTPENGMAKELEISSLTSVLDDEEKKTENEESEDPILKLAIDSESEEKIQDPSMLRSDLFRAPEVDEPEKKLNWKEKLLANAVNLKPMIKSSPGEFIDLTDVGEMKKGATKLLDRFVTRHSTVRKAAFEEIAEVKVLRTEGSGDNIEVIEEILPFKRAIVEDDGKKEGKPGEKLKKLREDLKRKIATARTEEWKHKEEHEEDEDDEEGGKGKDDFYKDLPDEEELLDDEESAESEPEENDIPIVENKKKDCAFADEEAEEDDEEGEDVGGEVDEDDEEENEEEEEEEEDEDEEEEEDGEEEEEDEVPKGPKKLKRIIQAFDDDDDDDDEEINQSGINVINDADAKLTLERTKTDEDMFASQASNGSADAEAERIDSFQARNRCESDSRSQACKTPLLKSDNVLSMMSPIAQLTALNTSLDSTKKSSSKTTTFNLGQISTENTPTENSENRPQTTCSVEKMANLQKKLFEDPPETVNDEEILELCSGKFTNTQSSGVPAIDSQNGVTESQLMDICSGAFTSQPMDMKKFGSSSAIHLDDTSQDITLTLDEDEENKISPTKHLSDTKPSDESMFSSDSKSSKGSSFGTNSFKNPMDAWLKKVSTKPAIIESQQEKDQVTDSQILDICSGAFVSQAVETQGKNVASIPSSAAHLKDNQVTESQILDICSGAFVTQQFDMNGSQQNNGPLAHDETSQNFVLSLDANSPKKETSKKQPESNSADQKPKEKVNEEEESKAARFAIASSSDEDDANKAKRKKPKKKVLKKKKVQRLDLSDDEDESRNEFSEGEESEIDEEEEDEEKFVDYDSEENEVIVVPKKDIKKVASKFLENEAELSESEWGSADEDEEDMDKYENEEGDAEDIDEEKMKDQLDRIHVKQQMDEDQRDVRLLQELLFDDGDLHSEGAGRERKFKWKNIDNMDLELGPREVNDGEAVDEEVDTTVEVQMRKMRYEQQKFLEESEKNINNSLQDDFDESPLGKLGLKVVSVRSSSKSSIEEQKITKSNSMGSKNILLNSVTNISKTTMNSKSLSFSNVRGSFLARGDATLVRIAQNLPEKSKAPINPARNRKFVFEHLSPSVTDAKNQDLEQENDTDNTPKGKNDKTRKRKILASQGQTPRTTKKQKVDDRAPGKKLF